VERLVQRDFRTILDFLEVLYAPIVLSEFPGRLVESLCRLIPCEVATYDEMNPGRHISIDRASPDGIMTRKLLHQCWRPVMHEHPVLMHCQRTGDLHAYRISDFYSQREFRRRALFHEFYRKINVEDALCNGIRVSGPVVVGCAFHRDRRSFTEKDCFMFDLIGPHLRQAWRNARAMSRLHLQMDATRTAAEAMNCGVVALRPGGRVSLMTPWAKSILEEFFGAGSTGDHHLPDILSRWVRDRKRQFVANHVPRALGPLVVFHDESQLVVRLLMRSLQDLLLLYVQRPAIERARLEARGLTRRETEVLVWVAKGKTNEQIGLIIQASPRTVQKHLEHIFVKLGVETRTAAAAAVTGPVQLL
jgi:DNA-binding CsgD family transcriptional regulator